MRWFLKNWFLVGLVVAVALGFVFPEAGATGGFFRSEVTTKGAVAVLFFIRGILLPLAELRKGLLHWRLHLLIHAFLFLLFPLGVLLLFELVGLGTEIDPDLRLGFIFLAALPTTVSTAAVFTSLARGNTAGSVFNATLSNCLGVFIVPLWVAWVLQQEAVQIPVGVVVLQIGLLVVVPLAVGQLVRPFLWELSFRHRAALEVVSTLLVLFVIYAAFANSVTQGLWREHGWGTISGTAVLSLLIFVLATLFAHFQGRIVRLKRPDYICLVFCGPQKTLAGGVTIANVLFAGNASLSLILLPVLFYHFIQLFAGGLILARFQKKTDES